MNVSFSMKNKPVFAAIVAFAAFAATAALEAQSPSALELLQKVDSNEIYSTIRCSGEIDIEYQNRRYVKTFTMSARANSDSFMEFNNPEDKGTKYLKKDGRLYVYSPDNEGVVLISGHMLKESMMGSDLSYEDAIDNEGLAVRYNAAIQASETVNGRDCYVLELNAKRKTESYPKRKLWIDKANGDLVHYELYALSGAKLKEYNLLKTEVAASRRFPVETEMRDLLRRGSRTVFKMQNIAMDKAIPDSVFSQRNLER